MTEAGEKFEHDFEARQQAVSKWARLRRAAFIGALVVLGLALVAIGYGWGWDQRSRVDCEEHSGAWDSFQQTCTQVIVD